MALYPCAAHTHAQGVGVGMGESGEGTLRTQQKFMSLISSVWRISTDNAAYSYFAQSHKGYRGDGYADMVMDI